MRAGRRQRGQNGLLLQRLPERGEYAVWRALSRMQLRWFAQQASAERLDSNTQLFELAGDQRILFYGRRFI